MEENEQLIVHDLHVLLEECHWFQLNAHPVAAIDLYGMLWGGGTLSHLTSRYIFDTDIFERIAVYQQAQNQLWSMYPSIKNSNDNSLIGQFNDAARDFVEQYRKLFHIYSNTPFQPTELSNYVDSL